MVWTGGRLQRADRGLLAGDDPITLSGLGLGDFGAATPMQGEVRNKRNVEREFQMDPCASSDHTHGPQPLGTIYDCGCTVRVFLIKCNTCETVSWLAGATDSSIGDRVRIKGNCNVCGVYSEQSAVVHSKPPPPAFRAATN